MINKIDFSELTAYKKHCIVHRDRYVLSRLFYQQNNVSLRVEILQYVFTYTLLHQLHYS